MFRYLFIVMILVCSGTVASEKIIVGISGGSGSGKTTLAQKIKEACHGRAVLLCQDAYYKDFSHLSLEERNEINFDHPDSLDFSLLRQHILDLKNDRAVQKPHYDFCTHARQKATEALIPAQIIIVEGILLFAVPEMLDLFDIKIFIDTEDDIRLLRRIERDIKERGRDLRSVTDQYIKTVKPMYDQFVRTSKQHADVVVLHGAENAMALSVILSKLRESI
ncbi:MAG: uridine kinase [Chlamydiota bacterium]